MRRRLYYIFPSVSVTNKVVDELLLKRIELRRMHVMAREDVELGDLPEASLFQKRDVRHSVLVGAAAGLLLGVVTGLVAHNVLDIPLGGLVLASSSIGTILGAWFSSMIGLMETNIDLKPFEKHLAEGKILLMVDVPKEQMDEVEDMMKTRYPKARFKGMEPTMPAFP